METESRAARRGLKEGLRSEEELENHKTGLQIRGQGAERHRVDCLRVLEGSAVADDNNAEGRRS